MIDDEPSIADALDVILRDFGCEVAVATTGRDALEAMDQQRFDFAILDFHLPDMSGLDVLGQLRRVHPQTQVILITARNTPELAARALTMGAAGVLPKPFSPADLFAMMKISSSL